MEKAFLNKVGKNIFSLRTIKIQMVLSQTGYHIGAYILILFNSIVRRLQDDLFLHIKKNDSIIYSYGYDISNIKNYYCKLRCVFKEFLFCD